jgi:tRNA (mo5U34)-methyltransferase
MDSLGKVELEQKAAKIHWFHTMDLGQGIVTVGHANPIPASRLGILDLQGKSVLDIGAWDGFYSFEAERRGAKRVLATDSFVWRGGWHTGKAGFELARIALSSKVEDLTIDVMELSPEGVGVFDVVLFLGVLYHLPHPLLALERIARVASELLVLETHLDAIDEPRPVMVFYPDKELADDPTNWWGPNPAAVEAMLRTVGFEDVKMLDLWRSETYPWTGRDRPGTDQQGRGIFHARKTSG